jgi:hypothetical protein
MHQRGFSQWVKTSFFMHNTVFEIKTVRELININLKLSKIIENKSIAPEEIRLSHLLTMLQNIMFLGI